MLLTLRPAVLKKKKTLPSQESGRRRNIGEPGSSDESKDQSVRYKGKEKKYAKHSMVTYGMLVKSDARVVGYGT
jgi:hypothetical protein